MTFKSVFEALQRRLGKDPSITLSNPLPEIYAEQIQDAIRFAFEMADWPKIRTVAKRTISTLLNENGDAFRAIPFEEVGKLTMYGVNVNNCISIEDPRITRNQEAIRGVFISALPSTSTATLGIDRNIIIITSAGTTAVNTTYAWNGVNQFTGGGYILEEDSGIWRLRDGFIQYYHSATGNVDGAWIKDSGGTNPVPTVAFGLKQQPIQTVSPLLIIPDTVTEDYVFVTFIPIPPAFTKTAYSASLPYAVGDLVYYGTTGECYECIQSAHFLDPTVTAYWVKQNFPAFLKKFVILKAAGELLADDQAKYRSAAAADEEIERLLFSEYEMTGTDTKADR